ncbi:hypothetical protein MNV49_002475 [Pseudohyphozyma bogoriensis]|nr:hypothetical protein MNV49_002475 [Pseudohyphozyma bogoriensis]
MLEKSLMYLETVLASNGPSSGGAGASGVVEEHHVPVAVSEGQVPSWPSTSPLDSGTALPTDSAFFDHPISAKDMQHSDSAGYQPGKSPAAPMLDEVELGVVEDEHRLDDLPASTNPLHLLSSVSQSMSQRGCEPEKQVGSHLSHSSDTASHFNVSEPSMSTTSSVAHASNEFFESSGWSSVAIMEANKERASYFQHAPHSVKRDLGPNLDPLQRGLVSLADATHLFSLYFTHLHPIVGFLDPVLHQPDFVRSRSAYLFSVVLAIGAATDPSPPSQHLAARLRLIADDLQVAVVAEGFKSIEILQGLLLSTMWSVPTPTMVGDRSWSDWFEIELGRGCYLSFKIEGISADVVVSMLPVEDKLRAQMSSQAEADSFHAEGVRASANVLVNGWVKTWCTAELEAQAPVAERIMRLVALHVQLLLNSIMLRGQFDAQSGLSECLEDCLRIATTMLHFLLDRLEAASQHMPRTILGMVAHAATIQLTAGFIVAPDKLGESCRA